MSKNYDERLFNNFKLYFPADADRVVDVEQTGPFELTIKMEDGFVELYCDLDNSIRRLPSDSCNMTEEEFRREFRFRLYRILRTKGVTQKELAKRAGITEANLSSYLTGKRTPSFYTADKIAKALNCSTGDFMHE